LALLRYIAAMCGRATYKLAWEEIVALYRLTLDQAAVNTRARYNVCPTTTTDTILDQDGKHRLERMRWGLIPSWWSKPLKDMKLATFNARAETVATKPTFRSAFKRNRCLIPCPAITNGRTRRRKAAMVLHRAQWLAGPQQLGFRQDHLRLRPRPRGRVLTAFDVIVQQGLHSATRSQISHAELPH
jgi:hypothetical protein